MVSFEVWLIGLILIVQPLIGLFYLYVAYRLAVGFAAKRAEQAVDGRIARLETAAKNILE